MELVGHRSQSSAGSGSTVPFVRFFSTICFNDSRARSSLRCSVRIRRKASMSIKERPIPIQMMSIGRTPIRSDGSDIEA